MAQTFEVALNAKINEFAKKYGIDRRNLGDPELFEKFVNYVVISNELQREVEDFDSISTGKAQGIDGIGIIVNDTLITDVGDLEEIGSNTKLEEIKFVFIQSTTEKSFDTKKFRAFVDNVVDFLAGSLIIEPFSNIYNEIFDETKPYIENIVKTPKILVYFASAKTTHKVDVSLLKSEENKFMKRSDLANRFSLEKIEILQKEEIKSLFDKIQTFYKVPLKTYKHFQIDSKESVEISLVALLKFEELKKLLLTKEENIRYELFVENPRYFLKETDVNKSIKKTLEDEKYRDYFAFLNNGITILCDAIERHPVKENIFKLKYPRIINGCQTVHILYECYKRNPEKLKDVEVVAKIIATENVELKNKIIYASNNQNPMSDDLLNSLEEFHRELEEFFKGKDEFSLYYERLRGLYSDINPPYRKVDRESLARVYISVFLKEPHKMKSSAPKTINEYEKKGKIFKCRSTLEDYYYCALLNYWQNKFQANNIIKLKSKTSDMHLLLICDLYLRRKGYESSSEKVSFLVSEDNARKIFKESQKFLESRDYLYERKGFYSSIKTRRLIEDFKGYGAE